MNLRSSVFRTGILSVRPLRHIYQLTNKLLSHSCFNPRLSWMEHFTTGDLWFEFRLWHKFFSQKIIKKLIDKCPIFSFRKYGHINRAELQPWFLHLQWKTCPWAEHTDYDEFIIIQKIIWKFLGCSVLKKIQIRYS